LKLVIVAVKAIDGRWLTNYHVPNTDLTTLLVQDGLEQLETSYQLDICRTVPAILFLWIFGLTTYPEGHMAFQPQTRVDYPVIQATNLTLGRLKNCIFWPSVLDK